MGPADRVYAIASDIAEGEVMTYGEIARLTGLHPRQVGRIVSRIAEDIAWWRIVRADGTPAHCHNGRAPALLRLEGIAFAGERIDWRALDARGARGPGKDREDRP